MSSDDAGVANTDFISLLGSIVELCVVAANQPSGTPDEGLIQQRISKLAKLEKTIKARAPSFIEPETASTLQKLMSLIKFYVYEPTFEVDEARAYEETKITPNLPAFESFIDMVFIEDRPDLFLYNPITPEIQDRIRSRIFVSLDDLDDIIHILKSLNSSQLSFRRNENLLAGRIFQFLQNDFFSLSKSNISYLKARWGPSDFDKGQGVSESRLPSTLNKKQVYFFIHDWISISDNGFTITNKDLGFIRDIQKAYYSRDSLITLSDLTWLK